MGGGELENSEKQKAQCKLQNFEGETKGGANFTIWVISELHTGVA